MHGPYGYYPYGQAPGAIAGGATAAASGTSQGHVDPEGFLGLNWKSIMVAVTIGSLTAILTSLTLEYVKERGKSGKKPDHRVLVLTDKP
jgi:hypothetical protein